MRMGTLYMLEMYNLLISIYCTFHFPACTYGSSPECVFSCNCADQSEVCDMDSGVCSSGCKDGEPAGQGFKWARPGCRVGEWTKPYALQYNVENTMIY